MHPIAQQVMGRVQGSKDITGDRKKCIVDMADAGLTHAYIGNYYSMPRSTVTNIVRRNRIAGLATIQKRGCKPKLSDRDIRMLRNYARNSRFKPLRTIVSEFKNNTGIEICVNTARKYLHQSGLQNYVAVSKPYLSTKNIEARKNWAHTHESYNTREWNSVIFSDESSFTVRPLKHSARVWRKTNDRYDPKNMVPTFKSGYVSMSVWGAFSALGRTPLVRINGTLNKDKYIEILKQYIEPFSVSKHGSLKHVVFQQDNCGPHHAKSVSNYLQSTGITTMKWPPQSPDLNPIENVWGLLKQKLRQRSTYPSNADALFELLQSEWDKLPNSYFYNLVRSMPSRAQAVLDNNGRSTKY